MSVGTRKGLVTELMNDDESLLKWIISLKCPFDCEL